MKRTPWAMGAVWLVVAASSGASATVMRALDLSALIARADTIFVGTALSSESRWARDGRLIVTDTVFRVDELLSGEASGTITVRRLGGTIGRLSMQVSGSPGFEPAEQAVLFTRLRGGHRYVVGMGQGAYSVRTGSRGAREVNRRLEGIAAPDGRALAPEAEAVSLEGFLGEIRTRMAPGPKEARPCAR